MDLYPFDRPPRGPGRPPAPRRLQRADHLRRRPGRGRAAVRRGRCTLDPCRRSRRRARRRQPEPAGRSKRSARTSTAQGADRRRGAQRRRRVASGSGAGVRTRRHRQRRGRASRGRRRARRAAPRPGRGRARRARAATSRSTAGPTRPGSTSSTLAQQFDAAGRRRAHRHRHRPRRHARGPAARPATRSCSTRSHVPVIASGGVGNARRPRAWPVESRQRSPASIVGRAIYENRFTVEEGIAACSPSA